MLFRSGRSVVEVVTDDMPFLVDSVTMELTRLGHTVHTVIHPQLLVERLPVDEGETVKLETLMIRGEGDSIALDSAELAKAEVTAKVVSHERGPKLRVVKFKPKRGYRRRTGHRQDYTAIKILGIKG